ncbi:hypothetical protein M0804_013667 [Polistes exclamans]|nr:hypothetical protein M0804_013667 [Polistes exclamans]
MIDTGAEVNLLKKNCIKPSTRIDKTDLLQLTGITLEKQNTLGTLIIRIFEEDVLFYLVDENFPIHFDGILGMDFLGSRSAIINNTLRCLSFKNMSVPFSRSESICVASRSSKISYCYIKTSEISEGYMPLLQLPVGIYAGEALIKNSNGKGFFKISNTTSKQYMFKIPRLELSDFREDTLVNSGPNTSNKTNASDSSEILSFIHTIFTEKNGEECPKLNTLEAKPSFTSSRAESVRALLRFDHLNLEEARVDKLEQSNLVYKIPCVCDKCYIGQTKQKLKKRLDQHKNDCKPMNAQKSNITALAEHHFSTGHNFKFDETNILDKEDNWFNSFVEETNALIGTPVDCRELKNALRSDIEIFYE